MKRHMRDKPYIVGVGGVGAKNGQTSWKSKCLSKVSGGDWVLTDRCDTERRQSGRYHIPNLVEEHFRVCLGPSGISVCLEWTA